MPGYNSIVRYVSGYVAVRQAFGAVGYASEEGALKPDLPAWIADAIDKISRLKTYQYIPCQNYITCDNKIEIPNEMALILCATYNGAPMTFLNTPGCNNGRLWHNSVNRKNIGGCNRSTQGFYIDSCYMHFTPCLPDGIDIFIDGTQRPIDEDGYPMIPESCILAVSEYICAKLCLRFRDNRYNEFKLLWGGPTGSCKQARGELNRISNEQIRQLGFAWYKQPVMVTSVPGPWGFGYSGNALRG